MTSPSEPPASDALLRGRPTPRCASSHEPSNQPDVSSTRRRPRSMAPTVAAAVDQAERRPARQPPEGARAAAFLASRGCGSSGPGGNRPSGELVTREGEGVGGEAVLHDPVSDTPVRSPAVASASGARCPPPERNRSSKPDAQHDLPLREGGYQFEPPPAPARPVVVGQGPAPVSGARRRCAGPPGGVVPAGDELAQQCRHLAVGEDDVGVDQQDEPGAGLPRSQGARGEARGPVAEDPGAAARATSRDRSVDRPSTTMTSARLLARRASEAPRQQVLGVAGRTTAVMSLVEGGIAAYAPRAAPWGPASPGTARSRRTPRRRCTRSGPGARGRAGHRGPW